MYATILPYLHRRMPAPSGKSFRKQHFPAGFLLFLYNVRFLFLLLYFTMRSSTLILSPSFPDLNAYSVCAQSSSACFRKGTLKPDACFIYFPAIKPCSPTFSPIIACGYPFCASSFTCNSRLNCLLIRASIRIGGSRSERRS